MRADIAGDKQAFLNRLAVLDRVDPVESPDEASLALVAWSLHHAYCALESVLERTSRVLEGGPPEGPDWHRELLDGAFREIMEVRPIVFERDVSLPLHDMRGFRHGVRHAYDRVLDAQALARLRAAALSLRAPVIRDIDAFDAWLEAVARLG